MKRLQYELELQYESMTTERIHLIDKCKVTKDMNANFSKVENQTLLHLYQRLSSNKFRDQTTSYCFPVHSRINQTFFTSSPVCIPNIEFLALIKIPY